MYAWLRVSFVPTTSPDSNLVDALSGYPRHFNENIRYDSSRTSKHGKYPHIVYGFFTREMK